MSCVQQINLMKYRDSVQRNILGNDYKGETQTHQELEILYLLGENNGLSSKEEEDSSA